MIVYFPASNFFKEGRGSVKLFLIKNPPVPTAPTCNKDIDFKKI